MVNSALRYRAQAPLIDSLLRELGIQGAAPGQLADVVTGQLASSAGAPPETPRIKVGE